tara:strand:+ start:1750 stop:2289 length:540 start_codon:yes stop_codon:yes gene_type:complete
MVMRQLHPGAKWSFRFGAYIGLIFILFFLSWFILPILSVIVRLVLGVSSGVIGIVALIGFILYIILIIVFGEIYARMAYNRWKYEFTATNLKKERGIIWKKYSNIPYGRVQNVDIQRGILARMFGFSSVMIHTAGYSGYGRGGRARSEGYLPAVSPAEAEQIREFLMKKITKKSSSGGM